MVNNCVVTHRGRTVVYHSVPWCTWYTMDYHDVPWYGIPLYTMVHHGNPWYTMVYHGISWYDSVITHRSHTVVLLLLLLLMTFVGCKLRHAANVPSQPLHNNSYPRTGTFSVVS